MAEKKKKENQKVDKDTEQRIAELLEENKRLDKELERYVDVPQESKMSAK